MKTAPLPAALILTTDASKVALFKKVLKNHYEILEGTNAAEALAILNTIPVDVILIDHALSDTPLFNLCRQVRKIKIHHITPIILISNSLTKTFVLEALNSGITDFLNEPLNEMEVYQRLAVNMLFGGLEKKISLMSGKIEKDLPAGRGKELLHSGFLLGDQALKEISKAKKESSALCVLMIELDDHSNISKKWGPLSAEEILDVLTKRLRFHLRAFDVLYPQGNGRYILILPKTTESAAKAIAETLRSDVSTHALPITKGTVQVTISLGLVSFSPNAPSGSDYEQFEEMLEKVSKALDLAKKQGNRVVDLR